MRINRKQDSSYILKNLLVCESDHMLSDAFKVFCSLLIVYCLGLMNGSVNFDDEIQFSTVEIDDVRTNDGRRIKR